APAVLDGRASTRQLKSAGKRHEAADDRPVRDVSEKRDQRRATPVVECQEAWGLQQGVGVGGAERCTHAWVNARQQLVDERAACNQAVQNAEQRPEPPSAATD